MTRRFFSLLAGFMWVAPAVCIAQSRATPCDFSSDRFRSDTIPGGQVVFMGGHVVIRCPGRNITIRGDSAERYPNRDQMLGHAVYDEPRFHVTSDYLTYFSAEDHVNASGNVVAKTPSGSTLVGPVADYFRADPKMKIRTRQQVTAKARPTITVVEKDSSGKPMPPMTVVADQVQMDGDSLIYGWGQVVINRPDISATADSAFVDQGKETLRLMRGPKIVGKKDRPFTLQGDVIDMYAKNRKLQRVIARSRAVAVSDSMTLKADTIDLRVTDDVLQHAYAWGKTSRAHAVSPSQNLVADSLDVLMPGQKIRLLRAVSNAMAMGKPDTSRFTVEKSDSTDWLRGDTIIAHFDSLPAKDTSKTPNIKQLFASGHAKSFYHMPASDSGERRPAINSVSARLITITFNVVDSAGKSQQRVSTVTATDSVVGYYIEPQQDSTTKKSKAPAPKPGNKTPAKPGTPAATTPLPPKRPPQ
ncbi:MAG: hypothetical protein ABI442_08455 [Gemmatimonadaceae bacterium]